MKFLDNPISCALFCRLLINEKLESYSELCKIYNVSRGKLRYAIKLLEQSNSLIRSKETGEIALKYKLLQKTENQLATILEPSKDNDKKTKSNDEIIKEILNTEVPIEWVGTEAPRALDRWMQYRKSIRRPYKPMGLRQLLKKFKDHPNEFARCVDVSISNNWQGLFPKFDKEYSQQNAIDDLLAF